jgi:hypothetical protein
LFSSCSGDAFETPTSRPSRLERNAMDLEGHELRGIEVGQGDIAPSAVRHIPSSPATSQIQKMLAPGGPAEWNKWIANIEIIERLHPRILVAGHN